MSDRPNDDHSLLSRLNALRPSNVDLDRVQKPSESSTDPDEDDDIARRFLGLRRNESGLANASVDTDDGATTGHPEEVESIEDMLKELKATQKKTLAPNDDKRVQILLAQANASLAEDTEDGNEKNGSGAANTTFMEGKLPLNIHGGDHDEGDETEQQPEMDEDAEADELLAQLLDEVQLEEGDSGQKTPSRSPEPTETAGHSDANPIFDEQLFPSTPSKEPEPAVLPAGESDGLQLPSAPTSIPTKPQPKPKNSLPKYKDEEIETWCEICQDDAQVRCLGCDGDLYCLRCWNEGHTSPNVGYEERRHRCVQYSKPGHREAAVA